MSAKSLNQFTGIGRIGLIKPERHTPSGKSYSDFTLAMNQSWKTQDGTVKTRADWLTVRGWNGHSAVIQRYGRVGRLVAVQGQIRIESYTPKREENDASSEVGEKYFTYLLLDSLTFLDSAPGQDNAQIEGTPAAEEEIPF